VRTIALPTERIECEKWDYFMTLEKALEQKVFFLCDGSLIMIYQTCSLDCREQCYTVEG
jgi:hypothetical protein